MEIPTNNYNPQPKIEQIVNGLLKDLERRGNNGFAGYSCFGASLQHEVMPALDKFKAKGWFTYYYRRFDGKILEVQIYSSHYTPKTGCMNQLIEY